MPEGFRLFDFRCRRCRAIFEDLVRPSEHNPVHSCGGETDRLIGISRVYLGNQDADWLKSVGEVVDKDPSKPHCREFLKNPTRHNYNEWMRGEGIRPMDDGEHMRPRKPDPVDEGAIVNDMVRLRKERNRVEINTGG